MEFREHVFRALKEIEAAAEDYRLDSEIQLVEQVIFEEPGVCLRAAKDGNLFVFPHEWDAIRRCGVAVGERVALALARRDRCRKHDAISF